MKWSEVTVRILKAGLLYFLFVFAVGFVLGPIRIFWLSPKIGERYAELLETPVMLCVIFLSARWIVRRRNLDGWSCLGMGLFSLALLLTTEFSVVLRLRNLSLDEYLAARDPVSGSVYYISLLLFALMPLLISRKSRADRAGQFRV